MRDFAALAAISASSFANKSRALDMGCGIGWYFIWESIRQPSLCHRRAWPQANSAGCGGLAKGSRRNGAHRPKNCKCSLYSTYTIVFLGFLQRFTPLYLKELPL